MLNKHEIIETINMIDKEHLDIRTVTMGISLLSCASSDSDRVAQKVYDKITKAAENLVKTAEGIEQEFGIPIINKRISVTPISLVLEAAENEDAYLKTALAMDKAAKEVGVNFIGGYSALVHKGMTKGDKRLIMSIPEVLKETDIVCSSVNVGKPRYSCYKRQKNRSCTG